MIELQSIVKSYPAKKGQPLSKVLDGVNLSVSAGEYIAIIGESGSGKSTLMHILGCLDTPSAGHYWLDGLDVAELSASALCEVRKQQIGFVFQGFQLLQKLSAEENVAFPLMLRGMDERTRHKKASAALESVGLKERAKHRPSELSGGQQQRVAIARALCYSPKLLLCDEPTGALDEKSRDEILMLLDETHASGHTIIIITHDPYVAARASRRYRMTKGRLSEQFAGLSHLDLLKA